MDTGKTPIKFDIYEGAELARTEILTENTIKIGKLSSSHLRIDDDSISRMHALIEVNGPNDVVILDLGSSTGTYINGERITKRQLRNGDQLQLGSVRVVLTIAGQQAPGRTGRGGRPIVRSAPLFDEEDESGRRSLEVLVLWGSEVINVQHFREHGRFMIGDVSGVDQFIDSKLLPTDPYLVAEYDAGGMMVNVPQGTPGEVMLDGEIYKLSDLQEAGKLSASSQARSAALRLPPRARCRLSFGAFTFLINSVAEAPPVKKSSFFDMVDRQQLLFLLLAGILHGLFFGIVQSMPEGMDSLSLDAFDTSDRFVDFILKPEDEMEEKKLDDLFGKLKEEAEAAAKAKGDEGKMGKQDSTQTNRRFAVKGPATNEEIQLAKARARDEALATANAAFNSLEGELSAVWGKGDQAIGSDAVSALGNMFGDQVGESRGFGGLGVAGVGRGGGGFGESSIGVGHVGTMGRGGRGGPGKGGGYGRGQARVRERKSRAPKVIAGTPQIRGSLDRETIRRIIRRHRNEYRYCYEKQLNKKRDLNGKITVKFTIAGNGSVIASSIADSTMNNSSVESCLTRKIKRWVFPAPKGGGIVVVKYPFIFKPS